MVTRNCIERIVELTACIVIVEYSFTVSLIIVNAALHWLCHLFISGAFSERLRECGSRDVCIACI